MTGVPGRIFRRAERFILRRRFISQRAGNQTRHGINNEHRWKLSATQHEVPDGDFFRSQMLGHALINAFIPSANKKDALQPRVASRGLLIEQFSSSGQQDGRRFWVTRGFPRRVPNAVTKKRLHRFEKRLRL